MHQKLSNLWQGANSIDELIQQFEIHGPMSRLGDIGLVHHFKQALNSHLRAGGVEPPPLVVKDGSLVLPFDPSPGHRPQSVDTLPQAGVECLLEVVDKSDVP